MSRQTFWRDREREQMARLGLKGVQSGATEWEKGDGSCPHLRCESKASEVRVNGRVVTGTVPVTWQVLHYLEAAASEGGLLPCLLIDLVDRSLLGCSGASRTRTYIAFPVSCLDVLPEILASHNRNCMPEKEEERGPNDYSSSK